jgi:transcriptional regulator with XRE-family HTH domain
MSINFNVLGEVIRDIRNKSNLTINQVADMANIGSTPNLTRLENKTSDNPRFETVDSTLRVIANLPLVQSHDIRLEDYVERYPNDMDTINLIASYHDIDKAIEKYKYNYYEPMLTDMIKYNLDLPPEMMIAFYEFSKYYHYMNRIRKKTEEFSPEIFNLSNEEDSIGTIPVSLTGCISKLPTDEENALDNKVRQLIKEPSLENMFEFVFNILDILYKN